MNTLLLSASARKKGNCDYMVRGVRRGLDEEGVKTHLLYLDDLRINTCKGCLSCVYKGRCPQDDDLGYLLEKMAQSRGLVVAAPTYLFSATGLMKVLTDRALTYLSYMEIGEERRWALTMSLAGNERWNYLGVESVNLFALAYQYRIFDYLEAFAPGPGEVLLEDGLMGAARERGRDLARALRGEATPRTPLPGQCPSCYSQSFRFLEKDTVLCPFCGLKGELDNGSPRFLGGYEDSFFFPENLREHLVSWVMATRDRFKENIPLLRKKKRAFEEEGESC